VVIDYAKLPHFPRTTVPGHPGRMVLGTLGGVNVVALQGRVHYYEGFRPEQVTFPARLLCRLGIGALVVTNAAGGINPAYRPGDLMAIVDHINLAGWNALSGPNEDALGPRFPDLSRAYPAHLRALLLEQATACGLQMHQGVYAQVAGPTYETPAEVRALRILGADAVGMSTVPEVVVAAHMGVSVVGLSCITNSAAGVSDTPLSHQDVERVARASLDRFARVLTGLVPAIAGIATVAPRH
jgi:purine-nucleoside phosphorylase